MKYICLTFVLFVGASSAFGEERANWVDGVLVLGDNPTAFQLAVSTTFPNEITSYDDFRRLMTDRQYIQEKAIALDLKLLAYQDLKARYPTLPLQGRINRLVAQIDLLYAIFLSLP